MDSWKRAHQWPDQAPLGASFQEIAYTETIIDLIQDKLRNNNYLLLAHSRNDCNEKILSGIKVLLDLLAQISLREFDIVLRVTVRGHQVEEIIVNVDL